MFIVLLLVLLAGACVHAFGPWGAPEMGRPTLSPARRVGRLALVWVLVGYCGIPMVAVAGGILLRPAATAANFGFDGSGGAYGTFFGFAYLGMALIAVLALRYRGTFLVAPAVAWTVFFSGATWIHLRHPGARGATTHGDMIEILMSHGLVAMILAGALLVSGLLGERPRGGPTGAQSGPSAQGRTT